MPTPPPNRPQLPLLVVPPHISHPIRHAVPEDLPRRLPHVLIPSRKHDLIRLKLLPIGERHTVFVEARNLLPLLDFDLAVGDELRGPDVDVVPASTVHILHPEARTVGAVVERKPRSL